VGGAAPSPFRAAQAEALLRGEKVSEALMNAVGAEVSAMCDPIADSHGPAEYKRKMAEVFVKRAIRAVVSPRESVS
jgi:carbon-monoxide dehydrogenase medium subunit